MTELTLKNMKKGARIISKNHPEWGEFRVGKQTVWDGATWWDIHSDSGTTTLGPVEFCHWELAEQ